MTGFSHEWLALREPADHRARDTGLVDALASALAARSSGNRAQTIIDLGSGTGSNLRALAPSLGPHQTWTLIDNDPALLAVARTVLAAWADRSEEDGGDFVMEKGERRIRVAFATADLNAAPAGILDPAPDLVTAAALFDLVSAGWIDRFAEATAASGALFYTTLSYDGSETWHPPHPADTAMHDAFLAHQAGDKGFGAALGPGATAALETAFRERGYGVRTASSPWRLGPDESDLIAQLKDGKAGAVAETGRVPADVVAAWAVARGKPGTKALIGHRDCLAVPGSVPGEHAP
ncbi:class I SAM-dependent methyltransferase [Methylobacterium komagatae]|uniref:Class I SAM-dependent methyltransferase n=1 Tax=Methylobacterium komagatae TaxID=374425 RepID=A0ABW2BQM5_9HYPH